MLDFLGAYLEKAERAFKRAEQLHELDKTERYAIVMMMRWRYQCQCIKWLASNVRARQEHLAIKQYVEQHGTLPT